MGAHTSTISRAGANASDTSTAAAFSWRVEAGTGSNPVDAADFPGGVFPSGTGTVAAGAATATVTFQSNPDTAVEQDETGVLIVSTTQSGVTITGSPQPFTITNDDSGGTPAPTLTYVYGPVDNAADSGTLDFASNRQQFGRTWRDGAKVWKAIVGEKEPGANRTGLFVLFNDASGELTYFPIVLGSNVDGRAVVVNYSGALPSASEPFTYLVSDATSLRYYCATTQAGANARLLATIPYSIWSNATFWERFGQNQSVNLPGKFGESNADQAPANGIYAARIGAVQ